MKLKSPRNTRLNQPQLLNVLVPWIILVTVLVLPITVAATSPLLAWREPIYIAAGVAGVIAMCLLLIQPLMVGGYLPGFRRLRGRRAHRLVGLGLLVAVVIHVGGLWVTSPPDVIDALLFRSPTPFSLWGVIAMWAVFSTALLAAVRRRLTIPVRIWRFAHAALALSIVVTSTVHAFMIEGTMGTLSKVLLCAVAVIATLWAIIDLRSLTGAS